MAEWNRWPDAYAHTVALKPFAGIFCAAKEAGVKLGWPPRSSPSFTARR